MKAIVVYESYWGNTVDVARAIAEGLGPMREGELDRARQWGCELAKAMG